MNSLGAAQSEIWAMEPGRLRAWLNGMERGIVITIAAQRAQNQDAPDSAAGAGYLLDGDVALIPIKGIILKTRPPWADEAAEYGIDIAGALEISEALAGAVADPQVKSILLVIDSPGGEIAGIQELADAVYAARRSKPIGAYASDLAASAAYWIGSQADAFAANRTAQIGSIGVYGVLYDLSEMGAKLGVRTIVVSSSPDKGVGVAGSPITDEQLLPIQEMVDDLAAAFVADVARGRGMTAEAAKAAATGRVWVAPKAQAMGLLDDLTTLDGALAAMRSAAPSPSEGGHIMGLFGTKKPPDPAPEPATVQAAAEQDAGPEKARLAEEAVRNASGAMVGRLKALEGAYPDHPAFARSAWERGLTDEQAQAEHYALLKGELAQAKGTLAIAEGRAQAAEGELAEFKAGIARTGAAALPIPAAASPISSPVQAYEARVKELAAGGDAHPQRTIAVENPQLHAAYIAAINAGVPEGEKPAAPAAQG